MYICTHIYIYMYINIHMYIHMYICMYIYTCRYKYTHTHKYSYDPICILRQACLHISIQRKSTLTHTHTHAHVGMAIGDVKMHPSHPNCILSSRLSDRCLGVTSIGFCYNSLYVSYDFGTSWKLAVSYVQVCVWERGLRRRE